MLTQVMCACPPNPQPVAMVIIPSWPTELGYGGRILLNKCSGSKQLAWTHKMKYLPFLVLFLPLIDTWGN